MTKRRTKEGPKAKVRKDKPYYALPLSEVRKKLSPLVRQVEEGKGEVPISVRGEVRAYLVAAERVEAYGATPPSGRQPLRGSLRLIGDLEEGSGDTSRALLEAARPLTSE